MSDIQHMSASDERRLTKVAERVISEVRGGADPTASLVKVARDSNLAPEHVRRVAEAYNVSRTLYHLREKSGSARLSGFPLADADQALTDLFPAKYATVGQAKAAALSHSQVERETHLRPENLIAKLAHREAIDRTELPSLLGPNEKPVPAPVVDTSKELARKAFISKQAKYRKGEAGVVMLASLEKAADEVQANFHRLPFAVLENAIHGQYGELAGELCDLLYRTSNAGQLKQARAASIHPVAVDTRLEPFPSLEKLYQSTRSFTKAAAEAKEAAETADTFRKAAAFETTKGVMGSLNSLSNIAGTPSYQKELSKAYQKVQNPDFRNEMTAIRTKALLSDLMGNDEVISTYDPDEVMDRYNELSKLSPSVAQQPMLVRPILRRALQSGAVDPFEVNQYVSTGKALGDQVKTHVGNTQTLGQDPRMNKEML